ncbi:hypothetical protein E2320_007204 [Naja naja]|nr:hypothetical protein E2320_007204 [Naja naja]
MPDSVKAIAMCCKVKISPSDNQPSRCVSMATAARSPRVHTCPRSPGMGVGAAILSPPTHTHRKGSHNLISVNYSQTSPLHVNSACQGRAPVPSTQAGDPGRAPEVLGSSSAAVSCLSCRA